LGGRHFCINARHELEHGAHGIDRRRRAPDQPLGAGEFGAVGPSPFETAHALDHDRSDRYKSDNDQPGPDAEKRIAAARLRGRCGRQSLGDFCVNVRRIQFPSLFRKVRDARKKRFAWFH
jgi:hypothetical protein